jgi:hypothetical protein
LNSYSILIIIIIISSSSSTVITINYPYQSSMIKHVQHNINYL